MGSEISLMAPTAASIAVSAYVDVLEHIQYRRQIGSSRFLKTIKATDPDGAVVVKLFIKPTENIDLKHWANTLQAQNNKLSDLPSVLPYSKIIETDRAGYLIRQFLKTNVYDRISTRPFLEDIEKKWIAFQLLNTLNECHERGVTHGDIKTENILVTSWNWVLLTDFAPYKPIHLPEDNPGTFSFYFDTSQRRICYLAPERFLSAEEEGEPDSLNNPYVTPEMDIFSLGCAIAEIFLEGSPIFTLSQLYGYKRGEYVPDLTGITDGSIRDLIWDMIQLDPSKRLSAKELLRKYRDSVFPQNFSNFLYGYLSSFHEDVPYSRNGDIEECDLRISRLHNDFDKLSYHLGYKYPVQKEQKSIEKVKFGETLPLQLSLPGVPRYYQLRSTSEIFGETGDSALILLSLIFTSLRNVRNEKSKLQALELILGLSERIHDEGKLDRSLPYVISLLNDSSTNVQAASLMCLTQLLMLVDVIGPVNVVLFPEYIIPRLTNLLNQASPYVRMTFAICLPHLAQVALRFYDMTSILKSNVLENLVDPETENGGVSMTGMFEVSKESLIVDFETFAINLLTDSEPTVKIALLRNILPLCSFFGKEKSNDSILSHLITYLNDKNFTLRIAFVESVVGLSIYVGMASLEHYILPLLVQTISDPEEAVVIKVLSVFQNLIRLGLIRKEFIWDLLSTISRLILHPNEWIKQGAISCIVAIAEQLPLADQFCMLYPIIRPYIEYDVTDFSWSTLYSVCKRPISRSVYNLVSTWSLRAEKTLFWKQGSSSAIDVFGNRGYNFVTGDQSGGKIVKSQTITYGNTELPLSKEDKTWVDRLITSGLNEQEIWKIADMREYIYRVSRLAFRSSSNATETNESGLRHLDILPRNVFFDSKFETEFLHNPIYEAAEATDDRLRSQQKDAHERDASPPDDRTRVPTPSISEDVTKSLIIGKSKAAPSTVTHEENAYGELESSFSRSRRLSSQAKKVPANVLSSVVTSSYTGKDPYIIQYLKSVKFEPSLEEFEEFSEKVDTSGTHITKEWNPKGDLVSHLKEHSVSINAIDISPDHSFFVTGDDSGNLKVWDTSKLDRNISHTSVLSVDFNSPIRHIKFLENQNSFGVSSKDGYIRIISVEYTKAKSGARVFQGLNIIRDTKFADSYLVHFGFAHRELNSLLIGATDSSEIIGIDIRSMKIEFKLSNNPSHGLISTFTIDPNDNWLLIGTSKGTLDLWDLRFKVFLRSWRFKAGYPIRQIVACSNGFQLNRKKGRYAAVIGGTGGSDAVIFDVSTGGCRELFTRSSTKDGFEKFTITEVNDDDDFGSPSEEDLEKDESFTSLKLVETQIDSKRKFWILIGTPTYDLILWNVYSPEHSRIIVDSSSQSKTHKLPFSPTYSSSQISPSLRIVSERYSSETELADKSRRRRKKGFLSEEHEKLIKGHHNVINGISLSVKPNEMILSVDRSGTLNVYK